MFEPIYIFTQMELSVESLCKSFLKKNTKIWKKRKKKAEQLSIQMYPIIWSLHTQQIMHPGTKNLAIIKVYTWGHTLKWTKIPLQQSRGPASTHKIFGIETGNSNEYLQVPASLKWSLIWQDVLPFWSVIRCWIMTSVMLSL